MSKTWKNLINNIRKEKLLSLSNVIVIGVTFFLLGVFIHVIFYSQTALKMLESQAQVTIFFKDDFTEPQIIELQNKLNSDPRISNTKFISKEEAFRIFADINKNEPILLESISASILPASLEIRTRQLASLNEIFTELSSQEGVEEVKFFKDVVDKFKYWSSVVYIAGSILLLTFFVISFSVIIATLRTTIHSKGTELEILKLVGASDQYVKSPLILQGVFFGGISAGISGLLLTLVTLPLNLGVFQNGVTLSILGLSINHWVFSLAVFVILVLSGVGLGYLGSITAVKKYLKY